MKKLVLLSLGLTLVVGLAIGVSPQSASAVPAFKKEFDALYVKKDSSDPADKAFAEAVERVKCNVCHKGKDKKMRNAYGEALDPLLDKKEDVKNVEKIKEALEKVAGMKSDPKNESSPTFGDLIKQGKLPGGEEE